MLADLEVYLEDNATPQLSALILEACKTLTDAGVTNHEPLLRIMMESANYEEGAIQTDEIVNNLIQVYISTLKEFGIEVVPTLSLQVAHSILKGIELVDNWDDPDPINELAAEAEDSEAALADILEILSDYTSGEYMEVLVRVSPDLMDRISQVTARDPVGRQPDPECVERARQRLRTLFAKHPMAEDSLIVTALNGGLRLGLPFPLTFEPYESALLDLPVSELAPQLVAFAYASAESTATVPALLNRIKESFTLSLPDLVHLDQSVKSLL